MSSPQTLSLEDRRLVAHWAADCAEHVAWILDGEGPAADRSRAVLERTRAFARGELDVSEEIRRRFGDGAAASDLKSPAARAAARAAGQALAVCHMGAHALGAAAYAAMAVGFTSPNRQSAISDETGWQFAAMNPAVTVALASLPPVGQHRSGPLGPGMLASGQLGEIIRSLQAGILQRAAGAEFQS